MISPSKLIEVANETIVFQGTNKMPSLENCERHDAYLATLAKHKAEITAARERAINKAFAICQQRIDACKPLTIPQMRAVRMAVCAAIGNLRWPELTRKVAAALCNRPMRERANWLQIKEWERTEDTILRVIAGGNKEWEKRK